MKCAFHLTGSFWTLLFSGLIFVLIISGCEDPGSVGNNLTDSETSLIVDTLDIGSVDTETLDPYSGRRTYFSLGRYNDPLFGNLAALAYLKPNLPAASSTDTMAENASMKLRLIFDGTQVYGDSVEAGNFDIFEIDQRWRGKTWRLENQMSYDDSYTVGSFTLGEEDSIDVSLNEEWINKYRTHFDNESADRDSTYRENFHGLAIIPQDNSKILPLQAQHTRFVIENPEADTFDVSTREWAFSLEREDNITYPEYSSPLHSTFEKILNFDIQVPEEEFSVSNISKAEIVFYVNDTALEQSLESESVSTVRPLINNLQLHLVDPAEIPANIDPGNPVANGFYDGDNKAYRFNITNLIRALIRGQINPDERLYITVSNDGTVKSTLLHLNSENEPNKNPELIITSVKNTNASN